MEVNSNSRNHNKNRRISNEIYRYISRPRKRN
nr:MAG TPA: hypothetical protein [Caudoviricetes sp.]DAH44710.1 MAG TPA: hypothetical protein [Caudoviricetes sp.]